MQLKTFSSTMQFVKRPILTILILITIGILFRGWIYRHVVMYKSVGLRTNYSVENDKLINYINSSIVNHTNTDIEQIVTLGLSLTSKQLNFKAKKNDNDPNKLISSKTAHCVGYASFFATTCNYLLKKHDKTNNWVVKPRIGKIHVFGINIHDFFSSPFFKDHDFVTIENKRTGEILAVDPTVYDYLFIKSITFKE